MRQLMERLELDLVEAKKVPPLEDAKEQKSRILGMLIAYGPRTVLPEVQQMLGIMLPQLRTEGVEFGTLLLLLEAKAGGFPCHRTA